MHDAFQKARLVFKPVMVLVKHTAHTVYGIRGLWPTPSTLPIIGFVKDRNLVPFVHVEVLSAYADASGSVSCSTTYPAKAWKLFSVSSCIDTTFDGITAWTTAFLFQMQHFIIGNADLLFHQVHAHPIFGTDATLRMGVHLQKIEIAVLVHQTISSRLPNSSLPWQQLPPFPPSPDGVPE